MELENAHLTFSLTAQVPGQCGSGGASPWIGCCNEWMILAGKTPIIRRVPLSTSFHPKGCTGFTLFSLNPRLHKIDQDDANFFHKIRQTPEFSSVVSLSADVYF